MGAFFNQTVGQRIWNTADALINWARQNSLWPMFFGLSCCFIEEAAVLTPRYDLARFGAEILRPSPRQADLLITSGTIFKKIAPVILRLYEQMAEPKWVISMGSCSNCGGMYDGYSVVQGIDQILPVDVYIPGCPPRPEAVLQGVILLQEKIRTERPGRTLFHMSGGTQGSQKAISVDGQTKARDARGPGMDGAVIRGTSTTPPNFRGSRSELMWTPPPRLLQLNATECALLRQLQHRFGEAVAPVPKTSDMVTVGVDRAHVKEVLRFLKTKAVPRFRRLDDLTAIDQSARRHSEQYSDYTMVYQLLSFDPAARIRLQVPLIGESPTVDTITDIWPSADWYEREVFDMFGCHFKGHRNLKRLLMPHDWEGHPLRKSYPGRATQLSPYTVEDARRQQPLDAGVYTKGSDGEHELILNVGPHHVGTHGLMRYISSLKGETITDLQMDIGYHHRAVEKIGERQSWHQFIPYTDRVDYLAGAANNLPYVIAVETLAGISVPERAQVIRVMLSEFFRLSNHLVWFATFAHDTGAMSPNFYAFREREMIMDIVELITGGRLHPSWFRLGGSLPICPKNGKTPSSNS
jgi:NADH-quinone oxidoreductase subunit B/C/D